MKKFFLVLIGIILAIVFIEISLQIVSFIVKEYKEYAIKKSIKSKKDITIMCIGESTTCGQYPLQLQKCLSENYKKFSFNVIDKGLSGQKSINIFNELDNCIKKYNPDIVISMIGINDWKILPWDKNKNSPFFQICTNLKTYKILCFYLDILLQSKQNIKEEIIFNEKWSESNESNEIISKACRIDKSFKNLYYNSNKYLNYNLFANSSGMDYAMLYEVLLKGNVKNNFDYIKFNREIFYYKDLDYILGNMDEYDYNDTILGRIAVNYLEHKDYPNSEKYFELAEMYRMKYYNLGTKITYSKIVDEVFNHNIQLIAVQYPVRSIKSLQNILKNTEYYDKIIFVSNELSFKQALKIKKYDEIFLDRFAGDFGHCTKLGNEMIAENVCKVIIDYLDKNITD